MTAAPWHARWMALPLALEVIGRLSGALSAKSYFAELSAAAFDELADGRRLALAKRRLKRSTALR